MTMAFVDDLLLSLPARAYVIYLFLAYLAGFVTLPFRGVGVWVSRSRTFDSCSGSWNGGFREFPIILHVRFIRVG